MGGFQGEVCLSASKDRKDEYFIAISFDAIQKAGESAEAYRVRLFRNKELYSLTNEDIGRLCNTAMGVNYTESAHRKFVQPYIHGYDDAVAELGNVEEKYRELVEENRLAKEELQRERMKFQTEKLEYNRWQRELARDELIFEKIESAIKNLDPIKIPERSFQNTLHDKKLCLLFGDCHYGTEVCIKGLFGEVINKYNPEIFEDRMWRLFDKTLEIIKKEGVDSINVYDFSDSIDGLLRVSQLMNLRYGVIESALKYAEFLSNWLNELSKHVLVQFQMVMDANHSQLRLINQPKNTFKNENMTKVILAFIKERLKGNPNIAIVSNDTGMIFDTVAGYNLLGIHGEVKNMESALKDFSSIYDVKINYLIGAHIHHKKQEEVGMDVEVINIPSIIGIDDYSLSLRKTSNAGAKLICFEEGNGKAIDYYIKLQ